MALPLRRLLAGFAAGAAAGWLAGLLRTPANAPAGSSAGGAPHLPQEGFGDAPAEDAPVAVQEAADAAADDAARQPAE